MRNDVLESIFFCIWSLCCCVRELGYGIEEMNVFIELACLVARIHTDQKNSKKKKKVIVSQIFYFIIFAYEKLSNFIFICLPPRKR